MQRKHHLLIAVSFIISAALLAFAMRDVDLHDVVALIAHSNWGLAIPMLAAYAGYYWLKLIRWQFLLKPLQDCRQSSLFVPMMLGFFANNLLPARLGEFVRMYLGAKALSLKNSQVLGSIALERMLDILAVLLLFLFALASVENPAAAFLPLGYVAAFIAVLVLFTLTVFTIWTQLFLKLFAWTLTILPAGLAHKIFAQVELAVEALHAIRDKRLIAIIALTSIGQWLLLAVTIHFSIVAVDIHIDLSAAIFVLLFTVLAVTIPSAPGFFGSIQAAFVFALTQLNVIESDAIAASVFFHFFTYCSVTLLGFYLLKKSNIKLKQIKQQSENARDDIEDATS